MATTNNQEVIPSAKRLIRSLRDMGYDFSIAVADLVDNSIEAGATLIIIDVEFHGDNSWVRIVDNGLGMNVSQLKEAMRYGSEREYDTEQDLGKFGLGLKTASMSQCQKLTVASRSNPKTKEINAFCWDLDYIDKTNKWEILKVDEKGMESILGGYLSNSTGTIIFWQKLDRILGYKHPYGEMARTRMAAMCRELEEHLAMVFHRFLSGEVLGKDLKIFLNSNLIKPWDPFTRHEPKTQCLDKISIRVDHESISGIITLQPYVLPSQNDFTSKDEFNRASGPNKWNRQQGFYIYRANRLIQSGGWSGLRTVDEHTKLARVAINFSPHLDEAFKVNVSKMRVQLPVQIKDQIEISIRPVIKIAQDTYRKSNQKSLQTSSEGISTQLNSQNPNPSILMTQMPNTTSSAKTFSNLINKQEPCKLWELNELQSCLENIAEIDEKPIIRKVFNRFKKTLDHKDLI